MECVFVCMHVQCVYIEIITSHAQTLKHFLQSQPLAIPATQTAEHDAGVSGLS